MSAFVKLFWQEDCVRCVPAKEVCNVLIKKKNVPVRLFDISTIDGMTEAAFHEVISTPTTIIVDDDDNELDSWRGEAPSLQELEERLYNFTRMIPPSSKL
jgi:hypothetical protein